MHRLPNIRSLAPLSVRNSSGPNVGYGALGRGQNSPQPGAGGRHLLSVKLQPVENICQIITNYSSGCINYFYVHD